MVSENKSSTSALLNRIGSPHSGQSSQLVVEATDLRHLFVLTVALHMDGNKIREGISQPFRYFIVFSFPSSFLIQWNDNNEKVAALFCI